MEADLQQMQAKEATGRFKQQRLAAEATDTTTVAVSAPQEQRHRVKHTAMGICKICTRVGAWLG